MELVKQRNTRDCGVCVLAMALGVGYENVLAWLGRDPNTSYEDRAEELGLGDIPYIGVTAEEMCFTLFSAFKRHYSFVPKESLLLTEGNAWMELCKLPTIDLVNGLMESERSQMILGVRSKNNPELGHWVFWKDGVLYDPSPNPIKIPEDQLLVQRVILIEG